MNHLGTNIVDESILNADLTFDNSKPYEFSKHIEGMIGTTQTSGTKPMVRYGKIDNVPVKQFTSISDREEPKETKPKRRLKAVVKQ
jgi:hypothetical protein